MSTGQFKTWRPWYGGLAIAALIMVWLPVIGCVGMDETTRLRLENARLQGELQNLKDELDDRDMGIERSKTTLTAAGTALADFKEDIQEAKRERNKARSETRTLSKELQDTRSQLDEYRMRCERAQKEIADLRTALNRLTGHLGSSTRPAR